MNNIKKDFPLLENRNITFGYIITVFGFVVNPPVHEDSILHQFIINLALLNILILPLK